jgi:hypothetical protein
MRYRQFDVGKTDTVYCMTDGTEAIGDEVERIEAIQCRRCQEEAA